MTLSLGTVRPGSTIYIPFATYDKDDGSSITMTGLAATDIEVYKDGSVTQRSSDNGYTLLDTDGIDFDGITGAHGFSISLADNSDAGFYAAGSRYFVWVSTITVDGVTVTFLAAVFDIGYPDAVLNTTIATLSSQTSFTLTAGPAEDDALNGCVVRIHDVASAVQAGFAVVNDYTGSTKTVTLAAGTTFTAATTDNVSFYPPANVNYWAGTGVATPHTAGYPVATVKDGTGTGEIDTSSGMVQIADGHLVAAKFGADAFTAAKFASDVATEFAAPILAVLGALNDAAVDGDPTTSDTVMQYVKQIVNTLVGTAGIPTWPAAAAPGNAVSIAEALRYLYDQVGVAGAGLTAADDAVLTAIGALNNLSQANIRTAVGLASANLDTQLDALPTNAELTAALAAADDAVLAAIAALNNLSQANIRSAVGLASANLDTQLDALPTATENADALLNRDLGAVTLSNDRSPGQALRHLRNRVAIAAGEMTVYEEDDATPAWTADVTTTAGDPISEVNPT